MPRFRELAVEVTGRKGLAPVVPGDGSGRDPQFHARRMVRIMGSWVHEANLQARARFYRFRRPCYRCRIHPTTSKMPTSCSRAALKVVQFSPLVFR